MKAIDLGEMSSSMIQAHRHSVRLRTVISTYFTWSLCRSNQPSTPFRDRLLRGMSSKTSPTNQLTSKPELSHRLQEVHQVSLTSNSSKFLLLEDTTGFSVMKAAWTGTISVKISGFLLHNFNRRECTTVAVALTDLSTSYVDMIALAF